MVEPRPLAAGVAVSGQIQPEDVAALADQGYTVLLSHRPDGEAVDQPGHAELAQAAEAAGVRFCAVPARGLPDRGVVEATAAVLESMGPDDGLLMFCASGLRSTAAWAMAEALRGADPQALRDSAAAAGYDLSRIPF